MFPGERLPARGNVGCPGWRHAHRVGVRCAITMEKHARNGVPLGQHSLCKSQGRQAGGRSDSYSSAEARVAATDNQIKALANAFPAWVKYTPLKYQSTSAFNYTCVPMGGYPVKLEIPNYSA